MLARKLEDALRQAGVPVTGVSIGNTDDRATWRVAPAALQTQAQPLIDTFVLPTTEQLADEQAAHEIDDARAIRSTVIFVLRRLLGRNPTVAERQAARDEWVAIYKALS